MTRSVVRNRVGLRPRRWQLDSKLRDLRKHHGLSAAALLAWSAATSTATLIDGLVESSLALAAGNRPGGIRSEAALPGSDAYPAGKRRKRSKQGRCQDATD